MRQSAGTGCGLSPLPAGPTPLPRCWDPCAPRWAQAPGVRADAAAPEQPAKAPGPRRRGEPQGCLTSNWISTVPLSRPFLSCSMDPSSVSAPSGHMGKMASGKSWVSSSSDLISAKEWTAVVGKKGCVWLCGTALAAGFLPPNYTCDT